jgi:putative flippase GtrA
VKIIPGRKLFRYLLTAGTAAIVDVGGFALLHQFGVALAAAAVCSFCLAAIVNYLLSSRHAFDSVPTFRGFGIFMLAALGGLLVNVSVTLFCSHYLGVPPIVAKTAGVGTAFLVNFWLNLRVVFRSPSQ